MSEAVLKAFKWSLLVVLAIGGIFGMAEAGLTEDFRYIMITVLCFGAVSLMFKNWSELSGKMMAYSATLVAVLALLAHESFAPFAYYVVTDNIWEFGFYRTWAVLVILLGVPIMSVIFLKFDD